MFEIYFSLDIHRSLSHRVTIINYYAIIKCVELFDSGTIKSVARKSEYTRVFLSLNFPITIETSATPTHISIELCLKLPTKCVARLYRICTELSVFRLNDKLHEIAGSIN